MLNVMRFTCDDGRQRRLNTVPFFIEYFFCTPKNLIAQFRSCILVFSIDGVVIFTEHIIHDREEAFLVERDSHAS